MSVCVCAYCMYANKVAVTGVLRVPLCCFATPRYVLFSNYWSLFVSFLQYSWHNPQPLHKMQQEELKYIHNVQNLVQQLLPHVATDIVIHLYVYCHLCT